MWMLLRAAWRLLRLVLHVGHGLAVVGWRWPRSDVSQRHGYIGWWARKFLRLLGVQLHSSGQFHAGACLLAVNHVSWLDILTVHAVWPRARFVSKAEVRHWPLVGWMVAAVGTLFIERERKRDALRVVHQMAEALQAGDCVAVFPEGTTGPGLPLLPFHANLLQAAIATHMPVQPVALRYQQGAERFSAHIAWVGDTTLLQSVWRLLCSQGVAAHVHALPPLASTYAERRALAQRVCEEIEVSLAPERAAG
jgi:1-acyl-sn-glycerol-3-phosphate acyltransferase